MKKERPPPPSIFLAAAQTAHEAQPPSAQATPSSAPKATRGSLGGASTGAALDREREKRRLTEEEKARLESMLATCTLLRRDVRGVMEFILDHADCGAEELGAILIDSLVGAPSVPKLYVTSDVIYNSLGGTVPGASTLPLMLQPHLALALFRLAVSHRALGRISDAAATAGLAKTLDAWAQWRVFSPEFIHGVRAATTSTQAQQDDARQRARAELALCTASHEELVRACVLAGAPSSPSMNREELMAGLNLVGANAPEPVEGELLEVDEELVWVRE